jgi:hypothetical protein
MESAAPPSLPGPPPRMAIKEAFEVIRRHRAALGLIETPHESINKF